jgi:hypothetical protein
MDKFDQRDHNGPYGGGGGGGAAVLHQTTEVFVEIKLPGVS